MFASPLLQGLESRFQNKGDLPILRDTVVEILKAVENKASGAPELAHVILRDQGFTAKLLKVANSVFYNPTDKEINTVSRAVVLVGFDMIRTISMGLAFVEMFQKHHPGIDLKKIVANSFIAATQALEMAQSLRYAEPEQVFIAALLHRLGSMATAYYLPDEYLQAEKLTATAGLSQEEAERKVLGIPFSQVGGAFAKEWKLPDPVVDALSRPEITLERVHAPQDQLRVLACLSNRITDNLFSPGESGDTLDELVQNLEDCLNLKPADSIRLIETSYRKAREVSELFGIEVEKFKPDETQEAPSSPTLRDRILERLEYIFEKRKEEEEEEETAPTADDGHPQEQIPEVQDNLIKADAQAGLQLKLLREISQHLIGNQDINVLFNMILEGIHRGIGFERALLSLCSPKKDRIVGRYSLGLSADEMARQLDLPNDPRENIFAKSFAEKEPCFVPDIDEETFRPWIPACVRDTFKAGAFVLTPIHAQGNVIGFFYADKAVTNSPITNEEYQSFLHFASQANIALERLMLMGSRKP